MRPIQTRLRRYNINKMFFSISNQLIAWSPPNARQHGLSEIKSRLLTPSYISSFELNSRVCKAGVLFLYIVKVSSLES